MAGISESPARHAPAKESITLAGSLLIQGQEDHAESLEGDPLSDWRPVERADPVSNRETSGDVEDKKTRRILNGR